MKLRNSQLAALLLIAIALVLGACMNSADRPGETPASPTPSMMASTAPTQAAGAQQTAMVQNYDWTQNAEDIENRVCQISEISECRIVAIENTALAGVRFAAQYKGELTERIREMIAGQIKSADPAIQTVAVTDDEEDVNKIFEMSDKIRSGGNIDEMTSDFDSIVGNATTMR